MILQFKTIKNEQFTIECEPNWTVLYFKLDRIVEIRNSEN